MLKIDILVKNPLRNCQTPPYFTSKILISGFSDNFIFCLSVKNVGKIVRIYCFFLNLYSFFRAGVVFQKYYFVSASRRVSVIPVEL